MPDVNAIGKLTLDIIQSYKSSNRGCFFTRWQNWSSFWHL